MRRECPEAWKQSRWQGSDSPTIRVWHPENPKETAKTHRWRS